MERNVAGAVGDNWRRFGAATGDRVLDGPESGRGTGTGDDCYGVPGMAGVFPLAFSVGLPGYLAPLLPAASVSCAAGLHLWDAAWDFWAYRGDRLWGDAGHQCHRDVRNGVLRDKGIVKHIFALRFFPEGFSLHRPLTFA